MKRFILIAACFFASGAPARPVTIASTPAPAAAPAAATPAPASSATATASSAAASATPAAAAVPAVSGAPAREVVYQVSTLLRLDDITESFGGGSGASAPASQESADDHGTITVDVMGKLADGELVVRMSSEWQARHRPVPVNALVMPDGTVKLDPSSIDDVALELLPYFALRFVPPGPIGVSTHWSIAVA